MPSPASPKNDGSFNVTPLDRAINVLEAFTEEQPELSLSEMVVMTGLHKATAFRLLAALRKRHFVAKDDKSGRYRLGLRMIGFADVAKANNNFIAQARKAMLELRDETRQTIYLSVRMGDHRLDIEQIQGLTETRLSIALGHPKLLEIGAAGVVMLASTSDQDVDDYMTRTMKMRLATTDVPALKKDIARTRKRGYGESKGHSGLTAIAAPIWGLGNSFMGTVSIILSPDRFESDRAAMAVKLVACAKRLSLSLGAPG